MKLSITVGLTVVLMAAIVFGAKMAPMKYEESEARIPGEYIVVFKEDASDEDVSNHMDEFRRLIARREKNTIYRFFRIGTIRGYGAILEDRVRELIRSSNVVSHLECNQIYNATQTGSQTGPCCGCISQHNAPWGLVRTSFRHKLPWTSTYEYRAHAGHGVKVYILDTGIDISHNDFGNRAFLDSGTPPYPFNNGYDLHGHGTHVAGTVMADTFGVAKKATAVAIPVLNQFGSGSTITVLYGIYWVALFRHSPGALSIINMSLGGPLSFIINAVTNFAVDRGVHVVVAAGNSAANACFFSPASATKAVSVAASDRDDRFAFFSNHGQCVDIIAPGVCVTSTWLKGDIRTIQGTSMAAPHVAGVMAKYLSIYPSTTTAALKAMITSTACQNQVIGVPGGTPNRLVFKDCSTDSSVVYTC